MFRKSNANEDQSSSEIPKVSVIQFISQPRCKTSKTRPRKQYKPQANDVLERMHLISSFEHTGLRPRLRPVAKQAASAMGLAPASTRAAAQVTEAGARAATHSILFFSDRILKKRKETY
jgi:hypothetical protein